NLRGQGLEKMVEELEHRKRASTFFVQLSKTHKTAECLLEWPQTDIEGSFHTSSSTFFLFIYGDSQPSSSETAFPSKVVEGAISIPAGSVMDERRVVNNLSGDGESIPLLEGASGVMEINQNG
ncbi:hypothetical protein TNIN_76641, partial [Trichonephila inaurata madagascariensis]